MNKSLAVIRLTGELEIGRRHEIAAALVISGDESGVLLDFSDVTYADSSTLSELLRFGDDANRCGLPVAIVIAARQFARLVEFAGLAHAFHIYGNRADALTYLSQAGQT